MQKNFLKKYVNIYQNDKYFASFFFDWLNYRLAMFFTNSKFIYMTVYFDIILEKYEFNSRKLSLPKGSLILNS
jgi:hypothetical protein